MKIKKIIFEGREIDIVTIDSRSRVDFRHFEKIQIELDESYKENDKYFYRYYSIPYFEFEKIIQKYIKKEDKKAHSILKRKYPKNP